MTKPLWKRLSIVPSLLLFTGSLAAQDGQIKDHAETVVDLINAELRLPAERAVETFLAAGYDDPGGVHADALRYYLAWQFSVTAPPDIAAEYGKQAEALYASLEPQLDGMPEYLKALVDKKGLVPRMAQKILAKMNPDLPPPLVDPTPTDISTLQGLYRRLLESADATLEAQMTAIAEHASEEERLFEFAEENAEYWAITQKATMLRHETVGTMYEVYKAIRQAILMGEAYGLEDDFVDQTLVTWLHTTLRDKAEDISTWEWNYAGYFPPLRHRLGVLMSEMIRLKAIGRDLPRAASRDDTNNAFMGVIDLDTSGYPDRETQQQLENLKLQAWSDLLQWHMLMAEAGDGDPAELERALGLWSDARERILALERGNVLASQNRVVNVMSGHLWILASRLLKMQGNNGAGNALLAELVTARNFFDYNARQWMLWPRSRSGGGDWYRQPQASTPTTAIAAARAFLSQASSATDEERDGLLTSAASTLRAGILGLTDQTDDDFVTTAPELYQLYGYVLYRKGWRYRATTVALEALARFGPEQWGEQPSRDNPWLDRTGQLSKAGNMVLRLADDALAYASGLQVRTGNTALLDQAIEMLKAYKPGSVGMDLLFIEVVLSFQEGDWEAGRDKAKDIYADAMREFRGGAEGERRIELMEAMIKALRMATQGQFNQWSALIDANGNEEEIAEAEEELDNLVENLGKVARVLLRNPPAAFDASQATAAIQFVYQVSIAKLMRAEQYNEIISVLGPAFWEEMPADEELAGTLLDNLSGAVFRISIAGAKQMQADLQTARRTPTPDVLGPLFARHAGRLLADQSMYRHARRAFNMVLESYPALENQRQGINARRRLAQVHNLAQQSLTQITSQRASLGDAMPGVSGWLDQAFLDLAARYPALDEAGNLIPAVGADGAPLEDDNGDPISGALDLAAFPFLNDSLSIAAGGADVLTQADAAAEAVKLALLDSAEPEMPAQLESVLAGGNILGATASKMVLERMLEDGKRYFADLYEPLITEDEKPLTILAVAQTLWELGEFERAAPLYERYKVRLESDELVLSMLDITQREAWINRIGEAVIAARSQFRDTWRRRDGNTINRGNLVDLLLDDPGFEEEWYNAWGKKREDWPEEKYSWGAALGAFDTFMADFRREKQFIRNFDELEPELKEMREAIYSLAVLVGINRNLVEIYRQTGAWGRARELALELYAYDSQDVDFQREVVDATLQAVRNGDQVDQEEISSARGIAINLRNTTKNKSTERHLYWIAYCQVLELSKALGDVASIREVLNDNVKRKIYPWMDLKTGPVPDTYDPGRLGRGEGVVGNAEGQLTGLLSRDAVIASRRFAELFAIEGVEATSLPWSISEKFVADPENPTVDRTIVVARPEGAPMPGSVPQDLPEPEAPAPVVEEPVAEPAPAVEE